MNWTKSHNSISTTVEFDGRSIMSTIFKCLSGEEYVCLVWEYRQNYRRFSNKDIFVLIGIAETEIGNLRDEIKSQSAIWQEV